VTFELKIKVARNEIIPNDYVIVTKPQPLSNLFSFRSLILLQFDPAVAVQSA
jgi:hypothetical protein